MRMALSILEELIPRAYVWLDPELPMCENAFFSGTSKIEFSSRYLTVRFAA